MSKNPSGKTGDLSVCRLFMSSCSRLGKLSMKSEASEVLLTLLQVLIFMCVDTAVRQVKP